MKPSDLPPDWREFFEERAAIREYEGRYIRSLAETLAMKETVEAMEKEQQNAKPRTTPAD